MRRQAQLDERALKYDPHSTIQVWIGWGTASVGDKIGPKLYREVWGLLDSAYGSNTAGNTCKPSQSKCFAIKGKDKN